MAAEAHEENAAIEDSVIPAVVKNFINSEKAVALGMLVIGATVLAAIGTMTIEQWIGYTKWMATLYVGGKTAHGVAAVIASSKNGTNGTPRADVAAPEADE